MSANIFNLKSSRHVTTKVLRFVPPLRTSESNSHIFTYHPILPFSSPKILEWLSVVPKGAERIPIKMGDIRYYRYLYLKEVSEGVRSFPSGMKPTTAHSFARLFIKLTIETLHFALGTKA